MAGQPFIAPSSALDRRRLGKYEVLCRLSTGGMSQIYLATQTGIGGFRKLVVLKTILPDIGGEEDFVRMFLEEARTTAAFAHPNIAQVYELDVESGELFMSMEFVQGCTLVEMAKACRAAKEPIPIGFTLQSVRDTALALHYAHTFIDARGRKQIVIHRDVAEKNIMVTYEGVTKLLDFGIAKALGRSSRTNVGMVKGTSGYMSPEQIRGEPLDPRSDVFALGVVLHECLTGLRLFHGKSPEEGMMAALHTNVAPPSRLNPAVRPEVDAVVMKALQRNREDRYGTALEMARALEKAAPGFIWHPEQSGELVSRYFADRRAETRRLLETANFGADTTGELRIDALMAKVKAAGDRSSVPTLPPAPLVPKPAASAPPAPPSTPPSVLPNSLRRPSPAPAPAVTIPAASVQTPVVSTPVEPETSPARPKVLRAAAERLPAPPAPAPLVVKLDGGGYDDEEEAKTIPAAALPEEIRALRAKLMSTRPPAPPARQTEQVTALPADAFRPVPPPAAKTIPVTPNERTSTGETLSVSVRSAADWADEPEAKTAIETNFDRAELLRRLGPKSDVTDPNEVQRETDDAPDGFGSDEELAEEVRSNRSPWLTIAILLPLLIAAILAVLFAAKLPPFDERPTTPTEAPTPVPPPG